MCTSSSWLLHPLHQKVTLVFTVCLNFAKFDPVITLSCHLPLSEKYLNLKKSGWYIILNSHIEYKFFLSVISLFVWISFIQALLITIKGWNQKLTLISSRNCSGLYSLSVSERDDQVQLESKSAAGRLYPNILMWQLPRELLFEAE